MRKCRLNSEEEQTFHSRLILSLLSNLTKYRLQILMKTDHITMAHIIAEIQSSIQVLSTNQSVSLGSDWEAQLAQSLKQSISKSSPVLALFTKRIYKILTKGILSISYLEILPSYSLQSKTQVSDAPHVLMSPIRRFKISKRSLDERN